MFFIAIDVALLALCGVIGLRLPSQSTEALPPGTLTSLASPVGGLALLRAIWRLVFEVPRLYYLSTSEDGVPSSMLMFVVIGLVATAMLFVMGILIAQQKLIERATNPFIKDTLGEIASTLWPARRPLAVVTLLFAVLQMLPFFAFRLGSW